MGRDQINRKVAFFDEKARNERLSGPEIIQPGRAVRYRAFQWAQAQENPQNRTYLICKIDGKGPDVNVYFYIHGGGNLDTAAPRIRINDWIPAVKDAGTWRCAFNMAIGKEWP